MSHARLARLSLILAALGLNLAPALVTTAHAQAYGSKAKPAAAPADAAKPDTVRPEMFKLLDPTLFKDLLTAKKYTEAADKLTQAEAFPNQTTFETYVINRMRVSMSSSSGDEAMLAKALEASLASPHLPAADKVTFLQALANSNYNNKNYVKAIELMKQHQVASGDASVIRPSLARAYYFSGDYASAKRELQTMMDENTKAGKAPSFDELRLLGSAALKMKDTPAYVASLEKLVELYPSDDYWTDLLNKMQVKPTFNQRLQLDVLRLKQVALKTMAPEEYVDLAELALLAGYPTEAKKALDAGFAGGVLGTGSNAAKHKKLRDQANKGAAEDQKSIATGEAAALKAKDGTGLFNLGFAYASMEQFDKGIDLMEKGIAKGGLKRPEEAKLRLASAHARAGHKADAIKAFDGLKGDDGMSDLARYWKMWINRKSEAEAAPAAK